MTDTLSAKEAAQELGTDARTLRKFLRSKAQDVIEPVGQGKRYSISRSEVKKLKKAFLAWSENTHKTQEDVAYEEAIDDIPEEFEGIEDQDEIDATTEEVDLDDEGNPVEFDDEDDEPSDEDLMELEFEIEELD